MKPFQTAVQFELEDRPNMILADVANVDTSGLVSLSIPGRDTNFQTNALGGSPFVSTSSIAFQFERHEEAFSFSDSVWSGQ